MALYILGFCLSLLGIAIGYWLSGSANGFTWFGVGFTAYGLLRAIVDQWDGLEGE